MHTSPYTASATVLTAIFLVALLGLRLPPAPCGAWERVFLKTRMGNANKLFPTPRVYLFYPPMRAYIVRVHRSGCRWAMKTSSDGGGKQFQSNRRRKLPLQGVPQHPACGLTRPQRASLGARARSAEAIWLLLASQKLQMKCFVPEPGLLFERAPSREPCWRV